MDIRNFSSLPQGSVVSLHIVHFSQNKTLSDNEGKSVSLFPSHHTVKLAWRGAGSRGRRQVRGAGSESSGIWEGVAGMAGLEGG